MSKSEKHLLLFASSGGLAGGERNLLDIARALAADGAFRLSAVVPEEGPLWAALEQIGCEVFIVPLPGILNLESLRIAKQVITGRRIDIVHAHGTRAALYARLACRRAGGIPCVYTLHGLHYLHYRNKLKKWLFMLGERCLKRFTTRFVCVCEYDLRRGIEAGVVDGGRAAVIYNGIDPGDVPGEAEITAARHSLGIEGAARETGPAGGEGTAGGRGATALVSHVARFHEQKGQEYLIEAIARVLDAGVDARFVLVGEGERRPEIEAMARERFQLPEERVMFTGLRLDARAIIGASDVFVLSSLWEGFPYTVLEAMAAGVPVVATSVGGVPEAVINRKTGLLVEPRNAQALAEAMMSLLGDQAHARAMGAAGRARVAERFTLRSMTERVRQVYDEVTR